MEEPPGRSREGMAALVRTWADLVLTDAVMPLDEPILDAGSVLRPPADIDEIAAAERRLHCQFPASYRNFLLTSNGACADWEVATAAAQSNTPSQAAGLLPVAAVTRLADARPDIVENWARGGLSEPEHIAQRAEGYEVDYRQPLKTAILINRDRGNYYMCLASVPQEFDAGGEGAELWDAGHIGPIRYFTFESWLSSQLRGHWFTPPMHPERVVYTDPELNDGQKYLDMLRQFRWAPAGTPFLSKLDEWATDDDPYVRLAAAQGGLGHFAAIAVERLRQLEREEEPTVALAARATLRLLGTAAGS